MKTSSDAPGSAAESRKADGLAPCASCGRHVRASAAVCPFCDEVVASSVREAARAHGSAAGFARVARYALGVAAVSASAATFGCAHDHDSSMVAVYGGPPPEALDQGGDAGPDGRAPKPPPVAPKAH